MSVPAERIAAAVAQGNRITRVEAQAEADRAHVDAEVRRLEERIEAGFRAQEAAAQARYDRLTSDIERIAELVATVNASVAKLREAGAADGVRWSLGARLAVAGLGIVTAVVTTLLIVAVKG